MERREAPGGIRTNNLQIGMTTEHKSVASSILIVQIVSLLSTHSLTEVKSHKDQLGLNKWHLVFLRILRKAKQFYGCH